MGNILESLVKAESGEEIVVDKEIRPPPLIAIEEEVLPFNTVGFNLSEGIKDYTGVYNFKIGPGQSMFLKADSNPSTGYSWKVKDFN